MQAQALPPLSIQQTIEQISIEQVVERILSSRQITRQDQYSLLALSTLTDQEQALINKVFDRLRLGLLRVVN
ncbi:MAG: hypothetical protein HC866_05850 [Leptolyngbyaceae cyanobacterium RU_5_1]|nr:hypothetical protein [Leptolyngbyaceae cyanobacterium RU_5_1]